MHVLLTIVGGSDIQKPGQKRDFFADPDKNYKRTNRSRLIGAYLLAKMNAGCEGAGRDVTVEDVCSSDPILATLLQGFDLLPDAVTGRLSVDDYRIPLMTVVLEALRDVKGIGAQPDKIILIATDQPETEGEHRLSDTLYYAELLRRRLIARPNEIARFFADDIEIKYYTKSAANYAQTFPEIRKVIREIDNDPKYQNANFDIAASPGTPALTAALITESIARFGRRAEAWYVTTRESKEGEVIISHAEKISVSTDMRSQTVRRSLGANVTSYSYAEALTELNRNRPLQAALFGISPRVELFKALLTQGRDRLNGNRETIAKVRDVKEILDALVSVQINEADFERIVAMDDAKEEIRDLVAAARVEYAAGKYHNFLARVGTFTDLSLRFLLSQASGLESLASAPDGAIIRKTITTFVDGIAGLESHMKPQPATGQRGISKNRYGDYDLNNETYFILAQSLAADERSLGIMRSAFRRLQRYGTIRNLVLHNFARLNATAIDTELRTARSTITESDRYQGVPRSKRISIPAIPEDPLPENQWKQAARIVAGMREIAELFGVDCPERDIHRVLRGALLAILDLPEPETQG